MTPAEALAACEASVRRSDPDRYFAALFAPAERRRLLFALYAFNHEIARAAETVREPMMGEIRLQWWREAIADAVKGRPRPQPAATAICEVLACGAHLPHALEMLVDARSAEVSRAPFADLAALISHASSTAGGLMRIAAFVLDPAAEVDDLAREAGTAYGLSGILRALAWYAAQDRNFLPRDLLSAERSTTNSKDATRSAVSAVAQEALCHFVRAKAMGLPRRVVPAILPAALVPASLALVSNPARDPLRDGGDLSLLRRQLIFLRAAALGRL